MVQSSLQVIVFKFLGSVFCKKVCEALMVPVVKLLHLEDHSFYNFKFTDFGMV